MRRVWNLLGYSRFTPKHEIHRNIIQDWWVTKKLTFNKHFSNHVERGGWFWKSYYAVGRWYLQNIRKLMYGIELATFTTAIYLVNTGFLLAGIIAGVIGILITNRMSEIITSIKARQISNEKVDEYEKDRQRERDRMIL
jgi:sugar phosphate permease